jgi:rRNA maturation RNase YbeY
MKINFFTENIIYKIKNKIMLRHWFKEVIKAHHFKLIELNFILCSDEYLYEMNVKYLNHDTLTDVITFDNSEQLQTIEGDIFISIDRIRENAQNLKIRIEEELYRVMIHGILHLLGFTDKTAQDRAVMRKLESAWLAKLVF